MADKDLEQDDPYELIAHRAPLRQGADPDELMARCFVEEFALMGVPADRIMHLFRSEFFVGTHSVLEERGEGFVQNIIDSVFGPALPATRVAAEAHPSFAVPVIDACDCSCGAAPILLSKEA